MNSKIAIGVAAVVVALVVVALVVRSKRARDASGRLVFAVAHEDGREDLETTPGLGGKPARYCKNAGTRRAPFAFSADGSRLAYVEPGSPGLPMNFHVANGSDCEDDRVVAANENTRTPSWSSDGAWLAYATFMRRHAPDPRSVLRKTSDGDSEVFIVGAGAAIDLSNDLSDDDAPAWAPDSARLAFVSTRAGDGDVYIADPATKRITRLTTGAHVTLARIAWSPDGSAIAVVRGTPPDHEIASVDAKSGAAGTIVTASAIGAVAHLTSTAIDAIAWSPTGTHLVASVSQYTAGYATSVYRARIVSVAVDTGIVALLSDGLAICPAISPDGARVAMSVSFTTPSRNVILAVPIGGGKEEVLVQTDGCPTWLAPPAH